MHDSIVADMPTAIRLRTHARIADVLETIEQKYTDRYTGEIYRHLLASGCDDEKRLSDVAFRAGVAAFERYSYEEAIRLFSEGLSLMGDDSDPLRSAEFHAFLARATAHRSKGNIHFEVPSYRHLVDALIGYLSHGETTKIADLLRSPEVIRYITFGCSFDEMEPFEQLILQLPNDAAARLLYARATWLITHDEDAAMEEFEHSRRLAARQGDQQTEMRATLAIVMSDWVMGRFDSIFGNAERTIEIARALGDRYLESRARIFIYKAHHRLGRFEKWRAECDDFSRWAHETGDSEVIAAAICNIDIQRALAAGDVKLVEAAIDRFHEVSFAADAQVNFRMKHDVPAYHAIITGNRAGIELFIRTVQIRLGNRITPGLSAVSLLIILVTLTRSNEYALLLNSVSDSFAKDKHATFAPVFAWLGWSGLGIASAVLGRKSDAYEYLKKIPSEKIDSGWERTCLIAYLLGDYPRAIERFSHCEEMPYCALPFGLLVRSALADSLLQSGSADQKRLGIDILRECLDTTQQMPLFDRFVRECAERNGVTQLDAASCQRSAYIAGLTDREIEVIRHIANGALNKEIAGELAISIRTVHRHVGSILRKTGCGNRTEASRFALEHGLA